MNDFFPVFSKRETSVLDGLWDFCWLGEVQDRAVKPSKLVYNELSPVPGTFDSSVKRYNARGVAVYKRTVRCSAGLKRLEIGGLGLYGKVFWDGIALGECTGPYTSYAFDFETQAGEHALQILVDNRFSKDHPTLFHNYADFYAFGGIYRSVLLRSLPKKRMERAAVKTLDLGLGKVELAISTAGFPNGKTTLDIAFDNRVAVSRTVNIQDNQAVIQFLLASNMSEVLGVFFATLLGFTLLNPVHLLFINLITDCFPALALGLEKGEPDTMTRPPRDSKDGIFAGGLGFDILYQGVLITIITMTSYIIGHCTEVGYFEMPKGVSDDGMTMAFLTMSMCEIFHSFNMRSQRKSVFSLPSHNKVLWGAMIGSLALTTLVLEVPVIANAFGFTPVSWTEYGVALALAFLVLPVVELVKLIQRRAARRAK